MEAYGQTASFGLPRKIDWTTTKCQVLWAKTVMAYAVKENTGGNNTDQIFVEI